MADCVRPGPDRPRRNPYAADENFGRATEYELQMGQVVVGPWNRMDLLKELLERETKRLQALIELHKVLRTHKVAANADYRAG